MIINLPSIPKELSFANFAEFLYSSFHQGHSFMPFENLDNDQKEAIYNVATEALKLMKEYTILPRE